MNHCKALVERSKFELSLNTSHGGLNYYSGGQFRPERRPVGMPECDFRSDNRTKRSEAYNTWMVLLDGNAKGPVT